MGSSAKRKQAVAQAAKTVVGHLPRPIVNKSLVPVTRQVPAPPINPFAYFDHVYVLNLERDADRMQQIADRLSKLNVPFERFAADLPQGDEPEDRGPSVRPGHFACARSHRRLMQHALERGDERFLILEDDAVMRDDIAQWMEKLKPQLEAIPWDVFYLGLHLVEDDGMVATNLGRVKLGFHTHAYAVTRRAVPFLSDAIEHALTEGFNFDCYQHPDLVKVYANPILAIQEPNHSRILERHADRRDQYFPPFDEQDFVDHCLEARTWRKSLSKSERAAALIQKAKAEHRAGRLVAAENIYKQVLADAPDDPAALHYLGLLYHHQNKGTAAVELMFRAVAAQPDSPEFLANLGMVLGKAGRPEEAIEVLDHALEIKPDYFEAFEHRGTAYFALGKVDLAIADWTRAKETRPKAVMPHYHLGKAKLRKEQFAEAVEHLREAVRLKPRFGDAHNMLGCALRKTGDLIGASEAFRKSTLFSPGSAEFHSNLGTSLNEIGRPEEAVIHLEKAVDLRHDYIEGHWNLALSLLACGNFERGWMEYEWRRHNRADSSKQRSFKQPAWNGCLIEGRIVLLTSEQGLGDTLQFIRYASLVASRGAKVIVECQPALREILMSVKGVAQVIAKGEPLPRFDLHARLLSLPGIFHTRLNNIPADVPYLQADPRRVAQWKQRLQGPGLKVGIAWQGSTGFANDSQRSIPLSVFAPLSAVKGVRLLSLQKNAGSEQIAQVADQFPVELLDPPLDEGAGAFMDTAAAMTHLDLIITSDTAIAHLAGALGIKVWVGLGVASDWRWLRDRGDSPWYPTMRLFRQQEIGDWASLFDRIAEALREVTGAMPVSSFEPLLAPIGAGELLDRIAALEVKGAQLAEHNELKALIDLRNERITYNEQLDALFTELITLHESLLKQTAKLRACHATGDFGATFIDLSRSTHRSNELRAELMQRIDARVCASLSHPT